ncbi:unnamed protein product [Urochloa humidicola]
MNKRMSTAKKAKVSPAAPPPRSSPGKNPSAGRKGDEEEEERNMIWLDPEARSFDCAICFMPFGDKVFMCAKGHAACGDCRARMTNSKCHSCDKPFGEFPCLPAQEMLGEMNTLCKFSKYGCAEVIKYAEKRRHEESCPRAPYGCPVAGCTYRGMALHTHIMDDHWGLAMVHSVAYLQTTTVTLSKGAPYLVLVMERAPDAGEGSGVFLLLNGSGVAGVRSLSLVCLGPRPEGDREIKYKMDVRGSVPESLSMTTTAPCVRELEGFEPNKDLFVHDREWGPTRSVSVSIRIG